MCKRWKYAFSSAVQWYIEPCATPICDNGVHAVVTSQGKQKQDGSREGQVPAHRQNHGNIWHEYEFPVWFRWWFQIHRWRLTRWCQNCYKLLQRLHSKQRAQFAQYFSNATNSNCRIFERFLLAATVLLSQVSSYRSSKIFSKEFRHWHCAR